MMSTAPEHHKGRGAKGQGERAERKGRAKGQGERAGRKGRAKQQGERAGRKGRAQGQGARAGRTSRAKGQGDACSAYRRGAIDDLDPALVDVEHHVAR